MATRNYHHARKQKEQARKARQQEKQQQRRATRPDAAGVDGEAGAQDPTLAPGAAAAADGQPQTDTPAREEA